MRNIQVVIAILLCLISIGCAKPEPGPELPSGAQAQEAYRFEVRTFDPADPQMRPIQQILFASNSQPLGVFWEGGLVERPAPNANGSIPPHFRAVPVGGKPDKTPWAFSINGREFTLTETELRSGDQRWSVRMGEPLQVSVDDVPPTNTRGR